MAPSLVVIAGPNGAGKTSLTRHLLETGWHLGDYINPDEIACAMAGSYSAIDDRHTRKAQEIAKARREECLANRRSHCFETVMSHLSKVEYMRLARQRGFRVYLHFIGLEVPELSVMRVYGRVMDGGHTVPHDKIVARYIRTMSHLPAAIEQAHHAVVYDNSDSLPSAKSAPWPIVAEYKDGRCIFRNDGDRRWPSLHLP